ncbi:MAG TPA: hypothetical protein VMB35_09715 [Methanomicrobiales archaeon]|nr:hypothetical protein [Methanomicrobiales archaeon]
MTPDTAAGPGEPVSIPIEGAGSAVILVEDPGDTAHAASLLRRCRAGTVVAASPGACWELGKAGVPFQPIERFTDPAVLTSIGKENFGKTGDLCGLIEKNLGELGLLPEGLPRFPATDNFFPVKMLCDGLTIRARTLADLGAVLRPDTVFAFRHRPDTDPGFTGPFHSGESIHAALLGMAGWAFRPVIIPIPSILQPGETPPVRRGVLPATLEGAGTSFLTDMAFLIRRGRSGEALSLPLSSLKNRLLSAEHLVISGYGYSWNDIIPALSSDGYSITHWQPARASPEGDATTGRDHASLDEVIRLAIPPITPVGEVDISPLFRERLVPILREYLEIAPSLAMDIRERLARIRPRAVLCGTKSGWRDQLLARCAEEEGVPVVSWQHGAQGFFRAPMMQYVELRHSSVHLCFGGKVRETIRREFGGEAPREVVPVGSYQLQELASSRGPGYADPDILYATTSYLGNYLYTGGIGEEVFRDIDFWETQKAILTALGMGGRETVFKLHPGDTPSGHLQGFLAAKGFPNITVVRGERSFTDLVRNAGTVVLDCPSTTLLEAIAAGCDVLVLLRHVRLTSDARALLRKRAYIADDREEFTTLLGKYLRGEKTGQDPDPTDKGFLEAYGVHRLDGNVAERALAVIRGLPGVREPRQGAGSG